MGCGSSSNDAPPPKRPAHKAEIVVSGGGFRACSSGAVVGLALMKKNVWGFSQRVIGLSGGSWFLIALARGRFRHINENSSLEDVLAALVAANITVELSPEEIEALKWRILRGTGDIVRNKDEEPDANEEEDAPPAAASHEPAEASSRTAKARNKVNKGMSWLKTKATSASLATVSAASNKATTSMIHDFGSGAAVAVHPHPMTAWADYLHERLLAENGATEYLYRSQRPGPALYATCISPTDAHHYAWIEFPICAADGQVRVLHPIDPPPPSPSAPEEEKPKKGGLGGFLSKAKDAAVAVADKSKAVVGGALDKRKGSGLDPVPGGVLVMAVKDVNKVPAERLAAICGSAFAVDFRYITRTMGIDLWTSASLLPTEVTAGETMLLPAPTPNEPSKEITVELKDAGIDVNLPFIAASPDTHVLWCIDASAGGKPKDQFKLAMKQGHLPAYEEVWARPDSALYKIKPGERQAPTYVAIIMGLVDSCTMEPESTMGRRQDLTNLFAQATEAIDLIQRVVGIPYV